jgi:hypothetical protein
LDKFLKESQNVNSFLRVITIQQTPHQEGRIKKFHIFISPTMDFLANKNSKVGILLKSFPSSNDICQHELGIGPLMLIFIGVRS